ncbi:kynureninase [Fibrivirga algicola]|uniref:Kynureninase n=1 Tax=Fibrivirga algicola TaxID=2950420 RepID=A0ABX0QBF9_9BACT|nr:kynureninase [Fibrivirga algicola]ARK13190.1 kynureninase [Fibrella sp. ES10-3-2-2]NID09218.1 kynureninase [Fibrivirga algicola]
MNFINDRAFAQQLDQADPLRSYRDQFHIPQRNGQPLIYFCGNSLGLQPKAARTALDHELAIWQNLAVEGWFEHDDTLQNEPWLAIHERSKPALAHIVGGTEAEVCAMNNLTVNMHLLLTSFYQPDQTSKRTKLLTISGDFPSDQYALETHIRSRGLDPAEILIEVSPREGEETWQMADLLDAITIHGDELALILLSGVHYYTGQLFDMATIARLAQHHNVPVGFDLAHAVGNVPLQLHNWGVDFAFWCSYKYLNSGPGGVSGIFVHEKHHASANVPRLAGWWGYDQARRFEMTKGFVPMPGADGWQVSTPTVLAMAVHNAAVQLTASAGMAALRQKSEQLTAYLHFLVGDQVRVITPADPAQRGCQLSLLIPSNGKTVFGQLTEEGIIGDWREPNCIRLAPTPLYNTFEEVWQVGNALHRLLTIG